jgi:threonine dehydrogenase-like Zn-dependent dehydrogenase
LVECSWRDLAFPAELVDAPTPELPNDEWARVAVTVGGICGSDLHLFGTRPTRAPALAPYATAPVHLGHEIAGVVIEAGDQCPFELGTRVAVDPTITCMARGITPVCRMCAAGHWSCCETQSSRVLTPGMSIGYTTGLGGGWAEQVLGHHTMLHRVPDAVPDRGASLHEPVSICVHGILRSPPRDGDPVLVVGCGIIGLAAIAAARALFPACEVTAIARHDHQARAARACGAARVVRGVDDYSHFDELAALCDTTITGKARGQSRMLVGGFPYVIEAVGGHASITESLRLVDRWGTVLFLGAAGLGEVDLAPLWFKEAAMIGAWNHSPDVHGRHGVEHSVDRALAILAAGGLPDDVVVTHEFELEQLHDAIATAMDKQRGAIKVVFRPQGVS